MKYQNKRWKVIKLATAQNPIYQLLEVDLNGKSLDNSVDVDAKTLSVVNNWDLGTKFDITLTEIPTKTFTDKDRVEIKDTFNHLVTLSEQELYDLKSKVNTEDDQEKLNKTINLKITPSDEWTDTNYVFIADDQLRFTNSFQFYYFHLKILQVHKLNIQ